jgi:hypothetical protein
MVFKLIQDPISLPFIITTQNAITTFQKEVMNESNSQDSTKTNGFYVMGKCLKSKYFPKSNKIIKC